MVILQIQRESHLMIHINACDTRGYFGIFFTKHSEHLLKFHQKIWQLNSQKESYQP